MLAIMVWKKGPVKRLTKDQNKPTMSAGPVALYRHIPLDTWCPHPPAARTLPYQGYRVRLASKCLCPILSVAEPSAAYSYIVAEKEEL